MNGLLDFKKLSDANETFICVHQCVSVLDQNMIFVLNVLIQQFSGKY